MRSNSILRVVLLLVSLSLGCGSAKEEGPSAEKGPGPRRDFL